MSSFVKKVNFYFDNTTLHGFSYISTRKSLIERVFWIAFLIFSIICCLILFHGLIKKIKKTPIIIQQPDAAIHVKNIPFPAISFCALPMFSDTFENFSDLLNSKRPKYPFNIKLEEDWINYGFGKINWTNVRLYMQGELDYCGVWVDKYRSTSDIVISPYGWCTKFNVVRDDKMFYANSTAEYFKTIKGYNTEVDGDKIIPKNFTNDSPLFTPNKNLGFNGAVYSRINQLIPCFTSFFNDQNICNYNSRDVRVIVHSPYEIPDLRHRTFTVPSLTISRLTLTPQIKVTDETLLGLDADELKCYKPNEKRLRYFKTYTSINCLKECESAFILQKCGCVPYYFIINETSLICKPDQLDCFNHEYEHFNETSCKCYTPCNDISYDLAVLINPDENLNKKNFFIAQAEFFVNFKEQSYYPQIRSKYFTIIDWFSFVGGILGLFFGFSFLSAFEMIFHVWKGLIKGYTRRIKIGLNFSYKSNTKVDKILSYIGNFMNNSSIHGLTYISNSNLRMYERLAWFVSFTLSITTCSFMIIELKQKLTFDSISIASTGEYFNITQVPFPAVTFVHQFFNRDHNFFKLYKSEEWMFKGKIIDDPYLIQLYYLYPYVQSIINAGRTHPGLMKNLTNYQANIVPTIRLFSNTELKDFPWTSWLKDTAVPFAKILTSRGIGFTFNIAETHDIVYEDRVSSDFFYNYEYLLNNNQENKTFELPWYSAYSENELFSLVSEKQFNHVPHIYLHPPHELPIQLDTSTVFKVELKLDNTIEIYIVLEMITASKDVESLPLNQRMCYVDGERKLKFFKIYTQRNCEIECMAQELLKICGCVPFDAIRNNATNVCELRNYKCVAAVKSEILNENVYKESCNCLEPCSFIKYNYEFVNIKHIVRKYEDYSDVSDFLRNMGKNFAGFKINFKETEYFKMERIRQFTIFDFLSYIGGLLGLFAGISVLSLFEVVYFFTLRLFCELIKVRKRRAEKDFNVQRVAPAYLE